METESSLPILHTQVILLPDSGLIGRIDPVRRIELVAGHVVVLCTKTYGAITRESWDILKNCPFCGLSLLDVKLLPVNISHNWPFELREAMMESFNMNEIQVLCFDLRIDYDELATNTKSQTIVALIQSLTRQGRLNKLFLICIQNRPRVDWEGLMTSAWLYPLEVFKPHAFKFTAGREQLDSLNSQAARLSVEGKLGEALQIYQQVKAIDPYYPKIDVNIRYVTYELGRPYVDKYGNVVERNVYKMPSIHHDAYSSKKANLPSPRRDRRILIAVCLILLSLLIVTGLFLYLSSMGLGG